MTSTARTADRLAQGVAYAFNPFVLPPLLFGSILALYNAPPVEIGIVGGVCLAFLTTVFVVVLRRMVETGRTKSIAVLERRARTLPYLAGLLGSLASLAGLLAIV